MFRASSWFEWPALRSRQKHDSRIQTAIVFSIGMVDYASGGRFPGRRFTLPDRDHCLVCRRRLGLHASLLSVVLFTAAISPTVSIRQVGSSVWNALIRLVFYAILIHMLAYIRSLTQGLELRVLERTASCGARSASASGLERELIEVVGASAAA
jgi:hypothetical protein